MTKAKLKIDADPLGNVHIEWSIPVSLLQEKKLNIFLPSYKYEMSVFSGIPLPFSSIAETLECDVFRVALQNGQHLEDYEYTIKETFHGIRQIDVGPSPAFRSDEECIIIQFTVKNLVNSDKVFFNFVFTLGSPVSGSLPVDIDIVARFSYDINSHRFKTQYIDPNTGRIRFDTHLIDHWRVGDYIYGQAKGVTLREHGSLDLHVHGSRLPFKMDRRYFWLVVYVLALLGTGGIISLFKR